MRTKTSIFEITPNGSKLKIVAGRKDGDTVELSMSPSRALSFYNVLLGRKDGTGLRVTDRSSGQTLILSMYTFRVKEENKEGQAQEKEVGKRVVLKRGNEKVMSLLLREGGSLYLAEEIRKAIGEILSSGGFLEVGKEDFYIFANSSGIRVAYKTPPVFIPMRSVVVLRTAVEKGIPLESKDVGWNGKTFTVKGKSLPPDEGSIFRSVLEVLR